MQSRSLLLILLAWTAPAFAETYEVRRIAPQAGHGFGEVHVSKAVLAGQQARIWWATLLNPDCTAAGTMTTEIVEAPRHGRASVSEEPFYPNYVQPNPRAACDAQKAPGKQAFYVADNGFHGRDRLVLQNATSEGRIRRITVDIDVR